MNLDEYNKLKNLKEIPGQVIDGQMLFPHLNDRTLLYGYTCERDTWHVYIKDKTIHKVIYKYGEEPVEYKVNDNHDFIPDKRLYPETCDYYFCKILTELGYEFPFTSWDNEREKKQYYGKILE